MIRDPLPLADSYFWTKAVIRSHSAIGTVATVGRFASPADGIDDGSEASGAAGELGGELGELGLSAPATGTAPVAGN